MNVAHDVFSEMNPAFCAYALVRFTAAFGTVNGRGPDLPLVYLSLPVALSGDLDCTFAGTNKNTGLLEWLTRSAQVQIGLAERLNRSMGIVTDAIRFACFARVLEVREGARLGVSQRTIPHKVVTALTEGPSRALKRAERLGYWFAAAGSTRAVFDMMGLTV
jgi:Family of unknown function (DUF6521)